MQRKADEQYKEKVKYYKAGIYARLSSSQNEKKNESVKTQVEIAKKFIADWNQNHSDQIEIAECYIDLGRTGSNFDREAFQRLMQDIRQGYINCVIVKDLSRFGRNYLETGNYIEKIFPFLEVRFIAVQDGYDSRMEKDDTKQITSEIKNLINDMYARDFSVKACHSLTQRRQEGSYVGGTPPYGYKTVWEGKKRCLIPEESTAEIIRFIYQKFIETESYTAVADDLNQKRINPPAIYRKTKEVYCPPNTVYKGWKNSAVERIIKSETYKGNLVQGKTSITARDEKNRIHKKESEWIIKEQSHKALIDKKTDQRAAQVQQKLYKCKKNYVHCKNRIPIEKNIFDKIVFCGVCGQKITGKCEFSNRISKKEQTDILLVFLKAELALFLKGQKNYIEKGQFFAWQKKKRLEQKFLSVQRAKKRLNGQEGDRYREYRTGKLSKKDYIIYKMQKEGKKQELDKQEKQFLQIEKELAQNKKNYLKEILAFGKLESETVLTKELVETLIEKIYIYPDKRIEVLFACADIWQERMVEK